MDVTRRSFLKFTGGVAAGAVASPLPWKLLDDVSIWTQNWSWIARTPRGPVRWAHATCTLCPAGCGLRLRRVGDHTVSAWPVAGHPASRGGLCPLGLGAAQMAHHPLRVRGAVRRDPWRGGTDWHLVAPDEALADVGRKVAELRAARATDRLAVLDLRPGRALSHLHRAFLERAGGGRYLVLPDGREAAATAFGQLVDAPGLVPACDLGRARTVVSFGAPLLQGWCGAGAHPELARRLRGEGDPPPRLVQIESNASTTAVHADRWLPLRPGTETVAALALAHAVLAEPAGRGGRARLRALDHGPLPGCAAAVAQASPERTADRTGLDPQRLREVARALAADGPALAVGGGDPGGGPLGGPEERAIWLLDHVLGAVGRPGGVLLRRDLPAVLDEPVPPVAESLADVPDGSLQLLIVDATGCGAAVPPGLLRRKLAEGGSLMVGLSAHAGAPVDEADLVLPVPAPGEWLDDVPPGALAPRTTYAWSAPAGAPPSWSRHPARWLDGILDAAGLEAAGAPGPARHRAVLQARVAALAAAGRGVLFDPARGETRPLAGRDARTLARVLAAGGCWTEEPAAGAAPPPRRTPVPDHGVAADAPGRARPAPDAARPLQLMVHGPQGLAGPGPVPPVLTKLYRESGLRPGPERAHVNPATARALGLRHGRTALLATDAGGLRVTVAHDPGVMPGVVRVEAGPDPAGLGDAAGRTPHILEICEAVRRPVWRIGRAALQEVPA